MKKLEGKIAIVTGSGRGIGQAIAQKLASEGAKVVVNDLDAAPAEETVASIRALGSDAISCLGDVTAPDFGARIVKAALDKFGGIDIIVNNAGYASGRRHPENERRAVVRHARRACHRAVSHPARRLDSSATQARRRKGRRLAASTRKVVNISSIAGIRQRWPDGLPPRARLPLSALTKTMAKERGRYRVNVNRVAFGLIQTRDPACRLGRSSGEDRRTRSENAFNRNLSSS
jgi:3-oxoacyl-[acyl-carrier protein] reductase